MQIGFIGLGKMGLRMATKLLGESHELIVWNRSSGPVEALKTQHAKRKPTKENLTTATTIQELVATLQSPRIIWMMLPAGDATSDVLNEVISYTQPGDIVIDGGNAHFADTEKRYKELLEKGIRFLGIGVSGGIVAFENGYPLMVGGEKSAYEYIYPLLDSLAKPNGGHTYFGTGGAGHFVKMVHNAIEYGIMQSLGEGFDVLAHAPYSFDLSQIAKNWQKGTLVSGFMLDRVAEVLASNPKLEGLEGPIGSATGETVWTIEQAKKEGIPLEIIERSLEYRKRSYDDKTIQNSVTAKMISGMRLSFGGHKTEKK